MGRKLRNKLPKLQLSCDRPTEAQWQQLLQERHAKAKLRQKEYADKSRCAQKSNVVEGDQVLLQKNRENKLSPTFEPKPYTVIQKNGNAVILEDEEGVTKMRNAAHMKKLIQPNEDADLSQPVTSDPAPNADADLLQPATSDPAPSEHIKASEPPGETSSANETTPEVSPCSKVAPRPQRTRQAPAWHKDYVLK